MPPSHLGRLVPCRQPKRIDDGCCCLGLHRGVQPATAEQPHPGRGSGRVRWQAGQAAVHHPPGGVELKHVCLAQQGDAVEGDGLHRGGLIAQALLQKGGQAGELAVCRCALQASVVARSAGIFILLTTLKRGPV